MPASTSTLQVANPSISTVSRQPQTTGTPTTSGNVPFARLSRHMQIQGPSQSGTAFGALWTPTLKPVGGYLRKLRFTIQAVSAGATAATAAADAPYNVIQNLLLRDPFGQPIVQGDGFSLYLVNIYSGQSGMLGFGNNPATMPSYSAVSATTGAFTFAIDIPFESDSSGYGSLASMNASAQPQLQVNLNTSANVYSAITGSAPTLTLTVDEPYWGAPVDQPQIGPPDVGSSVQWSVARAQGTVASGAYQRIVLPRVGTWIHTLILVLRDSTNARIDQWPTSDLALWIDGVPILMESANERYDAMYRQFGVTRPTGVIVYTFRDSVQQAVSGADTYDLLLPTTPATLLEIGGTFGTISNAPATITAITGELYPVGGVPYTHLGA